MVLALFGAATLSTSAAPLTATDDVTDDVHLSPASDYAYLDREGELAIDVSPSNPDIDGGGVNGDGRTDLGGVFRVRYTGDVPARIWATADSAAVTFVVDGRPVQSRTAAVVLGTNESATVGLVVDTTAADGPIDDFEVHARVAESAGGGERVPKTAGTDGDVTSVRIERPRPDRRTVLIPAASTGESVSVRFDGLILDEAGGGAVTLDALRVDRAGAEPISLALETGESVPTVATPDGRPVTVLGSVRVTPTRGATSVGPATLRFRIDDRYLDGVGVDGGKLVVHRYSGTESSRVALGELHEGRSVTVETPGFSTFVVAVEPVPEGGPVEGRRGNSNDRRNAVDGADEGGLPAEASETTRVADDPDETAGVAGRSHERAAGTPTQSNGVLAGLDVAGDGPWVTVAGFVLGLLVVGWRVARGA